MATASGSQALAETTVDFGRLLDARAVSVVFQPLVDLRDGAVLGYEALARGPAGSPLERPDALFAAAYRARRVPELDWACRAAAFRAVLESGLDASWSLFVNTEPVSLRTPCPDDLRSTVAAAEGRLRVVMEVTERAVAHDPAGLLAAVAGARRVAGASRSTTSGPNPPASP